MILSTTAQIEGYNIREYKGVVTGETIIGANFMKDIFAGIRDIVGGRSASYEKVLRKAKDVTYDKRTRTLTVPVTIADVTATTIIEITK